MAIFRAGKRVGPFDIRVGFPRDKSLDNVDRDPRLKQRGNTENTIGRFRSAMAKAEGYARPARFAIRIDLPTNLRSLVEQRQNAVFAEGSSIGKNTPVGLSTVKNPKGDTMLDLAAQMGTQMNIHCDSISMPGKDLVTQKKQFGNEPEVDMVTGHQYAGMINASFYADKYLRERQFMELWMKMAHNNITNEAKYYDDYTGKMQIYQLGSFDGEGDRDVPTYGIEAIEVFPQTLSAVEYNYGASNQLVKINVGFAYKQWYNLTTDHVAGVSFGSALQTIHDVKGADKGLFGKLPIELQRAGREVFNSAKRQTPIGRLFKGKIFPPFT
tara:strand:+ start:1124 stop:2101 length:978 start_codon:yes stop_codon:yes gene_type:complete